MIHVVLHIGAHKSATTAIQRGLEKLTAADRSVAYVGPIGRAGPDGASRPLADLIEYARRAKGHAHTRESVVDGLCRLIDVRRASGRLIISDENILGAMPGVARRFYPRADAVRRVIDDVAARFETSVLLQSRETAAFLESCRRFRIMQGARASRLAFFEEFDLASASWVGLGKTLFDDAAFKWRVLPIERLVDRAATAEALGFVAPGWNLAKLPLEATNVSRGPLIRAGLLALARAGEVPSLPSRNAIVRALTAVEREAETAGSDEASALIRSAFAQAGVEIDLDFARLVHAHSRDEAAAGGALSDTLRAGFAEDYAAFIATYAAGPLTQPSKRPLRSFWRGGRKA